MDEAVRWGASTAKSCALRSQRRAEVPSEPGDWPGFKRCGNFGEGFRSHGDWRISSTRRCFVSPKGTRLRERSIRALALTPKPRAQSAYPKGVRVKRLVDAGGGFPFDEVVPEG